MDCVMWFKMSFRKVVYFIYLGYQDFIYRWQEEGYINWFASGVEIL